MSKMLNVLGLKVKPLKGLIRRGRAVTSRFALCIDSEGKPTSSLSLFLV